MKKKVRCVYFSALGYYVYLKLIPNASLIYASTTLKNTMISIIIDDYVSNYTADYIININNVVI